MITLIYIFLVGFEKVIFFNVRFETHYNIYSMFKKKNYIFSM